MSSISRSPQVAREPRPTLRYGDRIGNYIVNGYAGEGATSFVYRGRREDSFEPVAIKVLHPHLLRDETKRTRFLREARMMMGMRHTNVVRFHEILEIGDQLAFVMEFIEGQTLEEWHTNPQFELDEATLACLFVDVLRGLGCAHRYQIVHRDLKPANLMITFDGERHIAKIIDFGVARYADQPTSAEDKSKIVGTAAYISPEEVQDPDSVCPASDIYSVGVMMYEAACGKRPFEGMGIRELMKAHVNQNPEAPRSVNPDLTPEFESVIMRSLSKSPETRFETARHVIMALEQAIHAAYENAAEPLEEAETQEWSRVVEERKEEVERLKFLIYVRQYLMMAMTMLVMTGARGTEDDPHHLNRYDDQMMPFQ